MYVLSRYILIIAQCWLVKCSVSSAVEDQGSSEDADISETADSSTGKDLELATSSSDKDFVADTSDKLGMVSGRKNSTSHACSVNH